MNKEDKVKLQVWIPRKLFDEIRRLAWSKYGKFHGAISFEVEQALSVWLATHTQNHTKQLAVNRANPMPRVFKVWSQVKSYLRERFKYDAIVPTMIVPRSHIVEAITALRGDDERTVKKWLENFQKYHLIKWISGEAYEVL